MNSVHRKILVVAVICAIATGLIVVHAILDGTLTINLGTGTSVTPAPTPTPTPTPSPTPTPANVAITSASFNATGASPTIASDGQSVTFSSWQYTVGDTDVLSITVTNTGGVTATLSTPVVSGNGIFTFTPTATPSSVAAGSSATFTWKVTASSTGTATPTITISWT